MDTQSIQNKRLDFEFLRGFAVILVFFFHFNKEIFPYFFVGVDLFFLISGYVITKSILSKKDFNLFEFYLKRIKRIYPALIVILSIFILYYLNFFDFDGGEFIDTFFSTGSSIFAISNYYYALNPNYFYFSEEIKFLHHTWSLSIEIQFYILFGLLLYLLTNFVNAKFKITTFKVFLIIIFLSSLFLFIFSKNIFLAGYYALPGRLWEFLLGSIIYLYKPQKKFFNFHIVTFIFFLSFFILGILNSQIDYKIIVIFSVIYFSIVITCSNFYNLSGINKILTLFGKISFSFYLWHLIVLTFYKNTFTNLYLDFSLNLFISFILSFLTYIYIEKKFNRKSILDPYLIKILKIFIFSFLSLIIYLQIFDQDQIKNIRNLIFQKTIQSFNKLKQKEIDINSAKGSYFVYRYDSCQNKNENFSWSKGTNCLIENSKDTLFYLIGDSFADHIVPTLASSKRQITLYKARFENCYITKIDICSDDNLDLINDQFLNISKDFNDKYLIISLSNIDFSELKIKKFLKMINKDVHVIFMYRHPFFHEFIDPKMYKKYEIIKNKDFNIIENLKKERQIYFFDNLINLCSGCKPDNYKKLFNDLFGHFTLKTSVNLNESFENFLTTINLTTR
ncbi:acyltransferase [Candidatus Pelagibacter sp.]|nr:acyltransferase [Candidatus Pelagibacter sp.]